MLDKIKEMLYTFAYVTTGVVFAVALFITIFYQNFLISVSLLWQILGTSFLCVLGNLLYPVNRELSKRQMRFRKILHYFYINLVVFVCGFLFEWFDINNLKMVVCMMLMILVIFLIVSWIVWSSDKKISDMLNKQLQGYQAQERK